MNILRGKMPHAKKVVIYGPEGIGKTSLAAKFPDPIFIDTEGSTFEYDVVRFDQPTSYSMLLEEIDYVITHPDTCKTLVIDTADWAQQLAISAVIDEHPGWKSIEDAGYGKGYVYAFEKMEDLLHKCDEANRKEVNVVITAHAAMRKFELPDEMGSYDRWEMKLVNTKNCSVSALLREWADMVLFCNYKTNTVSVDKDGKKKKAIGKGQRVIYTTHHSCWDAKNRYGLADEIPLSYDSIASVIDIQPEKKAKTKLKKEEKQKEEISEPVQMTVDNASSEEDPTDKLPTAPGPVPDERLPKALRELMIANQVTEWDIENAVELKGYYPTGTPILNYDPGFIQKVLVGAWDQVYNMIKDIRDKEEIPF